MDSKQLTKTTLYDQLEGLSDSSRLWIWQSPQELSAGQQDQINKELRDFIPQWASHSRELTAKHLVLHDRFVIVALDQEVSNMASGCSIDSLTHIITQLSSNLGIDLLDRTHFCLALESGITCIHMNELSEKVKLGLIDKSSLVFNPLVATKQELLSKWLLPIGESWHNRFM